jgi:hypothetical protein
MIEPEGVIVFLPAPLSETPRSEAPKYIRNVEAVGSNLMAPKN